jgi:hypothetical protein
LSLLVAPFVPTSIANTAFASSDSAGSFVRPASGIGMWRGESRFRRIPKGLSKKAVVWSGWLRHGLLEQTFYIIKIGVYFSLFQSHSTAAL